MNLVACTHAADDARTGLGCLLDQLELAGYGVDRIHNVVILGEIELRSGLRRVKGFVNVDLAVRIDIVNTLGGGLYLVLTDRLAGSDDLAIDVGQAHLIIVDEVKCTDTRTRQRFYRVAAYTADAEHRNTRVVQALHALLAKQQLGSRKLIEQVFSPFRAVFRLVISITGNAYCVNRKAVVSLH